MDYRDTRAFILDPSIQEFFEMNFMRSGPNDLNHLFTVCNQIRQKFITLQKSIHRRQNFLHQVKQNKFFQTTDS